MPRGDRGGAGGDRGLRGAAPRVGDERALRLDARVASARIERGAEDEVVGPNVLGVAVGALELVDLERAEASGIEDTEEL